MNSKQLLWLGWALAILTGIYVVAASWVYALVIEWSRETSNAVVVTGGLIAVTAIVVLVAGLGLSESPND